MGGRAIAIAWEFTVPVAVSVSVSGIPFKY